MTDKNPPQYNNQSRGSKTKGYSYKDRYLKDKECPECGGMSVYKDEWHTKISYKCMKRSCRYNWFEDKFKPVEPEPADTDTDMDLIKINNER